MIAPPARRPSWAWAAVAVAIVLAAIPVVRMVLLVRDASPLQYSDYWLLVDEYTAPDGGLRTAGLFDFDVQNHPVVLPMLVYWANLTLFSGSNVALGYIDVVLGLAMVAMVAVLAHRSRLPLGARLSLVVLASYLLFSPNGTWNYVMAMSGTAWLAAGLIGMVAIAFRSRDLHVPAAIAASVAVITYATGLSVWLGVAAAGLCRRPPREWWREWPYLLGFAVSYRFYQQVQTTGLEADLPWPGVIDTARTAAALLGLPLGLEGRAAEVVGFVLLATMAGLGAWILLRAPRPTAAAWVGMTTFGVAATSSLAAGRYIFIAGGSQNRYSSVPSVALIGLGGLLAVVLARASSPVTDAAPPRRRPVAAVAWAPLALVVAAAAVLSSSSGDEHVAIMRRQVHAQELREVGLRLGIADGTTYTAGFPTSVTGLLEGIHHQPFVDRWDLDCGLLGTRVDAGDLVTGIAAGEITEARKLDRLADAAELRGRLADPDDVRCVVVLDGEGEVIGAGTVGYAGGTDPSLDHDSFVAIGQPGADSYRAVAVLDDGRLVVVGEHAGDELADFTP